MNGEFDPREFGELSATLRSTAIAVEQLQADMREMAKTVTQMQLTLANAQGGWRMFVGIGTSFFASGGAVWEMLRHFFVK